MVTEEVHTNLAWLELFLVLAWYNHSAGAAKDMQYM